MEKFPGKKVSGAEKIKNAARAAIAGATFLGAVGAAEIPTPAEAGSQPKMEQQSNVEREAGAFLNEIADMDIGIDDARGRNTLHTKIEMKFAGFVSQIYGTDTIEVRAKVAKMLLQKVLDLPANTADNPALNMLQDMLEQYDLNPDQQKSLKSFSNKTRDPQLDLQSNDYGTHAQPNEVRHIKQKDW